MTKYEPRKAVLSGKKTDRGNVEIPDEAIIVDTEYRSAERPNKSWKTVIVWLHPVEE